MPNFHLTKNGRKYDPALCTTWVRTTTLKLPQLFREGYHTSQKISGPKNVSYDEQLRPIIVKSPSAPSAQATHQIANRHYEQVNSLSAMDGHDRPLKN